MPGRLKPESRRRQILDAAARSIIDQGLHGTRVADVAARAGVSSGLVAYYFPTKDSMLAEALLQQDRMFYERLERQLAGEGSSRHRLITMIEASCPPSGGARATWALWMELWSAARLDPGLAATRRELDAAWRKAIASVIRRGQRKGEFSKGNAGAIALRLAALIDGLALQVALADPAVTSARMRAVCLQAAATELGFVI